MTENKKEIKMAENKEEIKNNQNDKQVRKRIPLGTRNILTAPKKAGFVRRFVNDKSDRIQQFINAGYSIVKEDIMVGDPQIGNPTQLGNSVSAQRDGQRKVLMEIPEEFYKEDYKAAQDKITKNESELRRNLNTPNKDGLYGKVQFS